MDSFTKITAFTFPKLESVTTMCERRSRTSLGLDSGDTSRRSPLADSLLQTQDTHDTQVHGLNEIMKNIQEYLPNTAIKFRNSNITGYLEIIFVKEITILTILPSTSFDEIKQQIDTKLANINTNNCNICLQSTIQRKVSCAKCSYYWCVNCYKNNFTSNTRHGKCPYCILLAI